MAKSVFLFFTIIGLSAQAYGEWETLAPGMELRAFASNTQGPVGGSGITILRIDPSLWDLELIGKSGTGTAEGKTAKRWCEEHGLTAAINAGMFGTDYQTHVGYMKSAGRVNSKHINSYKSVAAFDPREGKGLPEFRIFDLDAPGITMEGILHDYASVVQNLRLIKRPGKNRWRQQEKRWSEAALGEDEQGRALFIFSPTPLSMHDLNRRLLSLGIGLVAAQHLEGGPQAQIYLRIGEVELEMSGSHEALFLEDGGHAVIWPIPNIIGVRPKQVASESSCIRRCSRCRRCGDGEASGLVVQEDQAQRTRSIPVRENIYSSGVGEKARRNGPRNLLSGDQSVMANTISVNAPLKSFSSASRKSIAVR